VKEKKSKTTKKPKTLKISGKFFTKGFRNSVSKSEKCKGKINIELLKKKLPEPTKPSLNK
jgi:hypothetical protein